MNKQIDFSLRGLSDIDNYKIGSFYEVYFLFHQHFYGIIDLGYVLQVKIKFRLKFCNLGWFSISFVFYP